MDISDPDAVPDEVVKSVAQVLRSSNALSISENGLQIKRNAVSKWPKQGSTASALTPSPPTLLL